MNGNPRAKPEDLQHESILHCLAMSRKKMCSKRKKNQHSKGQMSRPEDVTNHQIWDNLENKIIIAMEYSP